MRRNPSESEWAQAEHCLLVALAKVSPAWVSNVRLAKLSLVQPGFIARSLRRLLAEGKVESGSVLTGNSPHPSTMYRLAGGR